MSKPVQFQDWPASIQPGFGPYRATTERVVDGDTIYAFIDLGLNEYAFHSIRMEGYNAPEIFTSNTEEKTHGYQFHRKLMELLPLNTKVVLTTVKDAQSLGRYRGRIRRGDGVEVNDDMIKFREEYWLAQPREQVVKYAVDLVALWDEVIERLT